MDSNSALAFVESLVAQGKIARVSSSERATKAIIFRTNSGRHFAVEINDVKSRGYAKQTKLVFEAEPSGEKLNWQEAEKLGNIKTTDRQFKSSAYTIRDANLNAGNQMSAFVEDIESLSKLINWYDAVDGEARDKSTLSRFAVEAVMDEFDRLGPDNFREKYPQFQEPRDFWVRPSRNRQYEKYPSKPIASISYGAKTLRGGWSLRHAAATLLHNAGYIIVDADNKPVEVPTDRYDYLIRGADRIRACALTNYIEPAREQGKAEVTIVAGKLHDEIGLSQNWANVCQALRGRKFQEYASVSSPDVSGPDASTTTKFTYFLKQRAMSMPQSAAPAINLILYGPPGTGKTYETAIQAVRLCLNLPETDPLFGKGRRNELMTKYRELIKDKRIEFVTFHQSYSYEEFVEGLRPTTSDSADSPAIEQDLDESFVATTGFRLRSEDGIFKTICERARLDVGGEMHEQRLDRQRPVFKIALGRRGSDEDQIKEGLDFNLIHLGWGGEIDWSDERFEDFEEIRREWNNKEDPNATGKNPNIEMIFSFRAAMQVGDYVVLSDGRDTIRAFGRVTSEYYYDEKASFHPHRRKVEWLWKEADGAARDRFYDRYFRRNTVYKLRAKSIDWDGLDSIVFGGDASRPASGARPHVLIIDEINRANISKVFGELITLLEPDKRLREINEIKVRLPYSKQEFGIPANLHIVGTMNTADRSIALLDTALRRRFEFRELMPKPDLLGTVDGIDLSRMLSTINSRIEYLFDREHQIGHAYFMNCATKSDVENVMRHKVIPLLTEYFYEDWNKVATVLGDVDEGEGSREGDFLDRIVLTPPTGTESDENGAPRFRWIIRDRFDFTKLSGS